MKIKKRTEIKIETHEVTIIRRRSGARLDFCAACGRPTPHLSLAEAADALSLTAAAVERLAAEGRVHGRAGESERLFCGDSLAASQRARNQTKE